MAVFRNPAKALSTTERTVKGNYYVMNPCSNEDASRLDIKPKTAEKYIRNFCKLHRLVHGGYDNYRKIF